MRAALAAVGMAALLLTGCAPAGATGSGCPSGFTHRATAIKRFDAIPRRTAVGLAREHGHSVRFWVHTYDHIGPRYVTFRRLDGCTMKVHV